MGGYLEHDNLQRPSVHALDSWHRPLAETFLKLTSAQYSRCRQSLEAKNQLQEEAQDRRSTEPYKDKALAQVSPKRIVHLGWVVMGGRSERKGQMFAESSRIWLSDARPRDALGIAASKLEMRTPCAAASRALATTLKTVHILGIQISAQEQSSFSPWSPVLTEVCHDLYACRITKIFLQGGGNHQHFEVKGFLSVHGTPASCSQLIVRRADRKQRFPTLRSCNSLSVSK